MKNVTNTKSTILLNQNKDIKRPFLVQTKLKETKGHTSSLLKRGGSVTKLDFENKSLMTTLSKSSLLTKQLPKQASRPYFPPINGTKSTLKLQKWINDKRRCISKVLYWKISLSLTKIVSSIGLLLRCLLLLRSLWLLLLSVGELRVITIGEEGFRICEYFEVLEERWK
jgi:hypothetical protein